MESRRGQLSDEMLLALAVWFCSLPLVAWLAGAWLGWQAALTSGVVLLIALLLACWGACGWTIARRTQGNKHR